MLLRYAKNFQGRSIEETFEVIKAKFWEALKTNWCVAYFWRNQDAIIHCGVTEFLYLLFVLLSFRLLGQQIFVSLLTASRKVWTPAQIINFTYVPLNFRVLFASFVALGWNAYLAACS